MCILWFWCVWCRCLRYRYVRCRNVMYVRCRCVWCTYIDIIEEIVMYHGCNVCYVDLCRPSRLPIFPIFSYIFIRFIYIYFDFLYFSKKMITKMIYGKFLRICSSLHIEKCTTQTWDCQNFLAPFAHLKSNILKTLNFTQKRIKHEKYMLSTTFSVDCACVVFLFKSQKLCRKFLYSMLKYSY